MFHYTVFAISICHFLVLLFFLVQSFFVCWAISLFGVILLNTNGTAAVRRSKMPHLFKKKHEYNRERERWRWREEKKMIGRKLATTFSRSRPFHFSHFGRNEKHTFFNDIRVLINRKFVKRITLATTIFSLNKLSTYFFRFDRQRHTAQRFCFFFSSFLAHR